MQKELCAQFTYYDYYCDFMIRCLLGKFSDCHLKQLYQNVRQFQKEIFYIPYVCYVFMSDIFH